MDIPLDSVMLSRMQFALTSIFHMLWPVLTTGMAIYLVIIEGLWLKTRDPDYYFHARFWAKLYVLNFGVGVATGLPMEFQFGTNWAPFSEAVGDFFGSILGFEGAMAFMLEAGFLGIMLFGWERVPPVVHYISTIMVAFGANLSTFWILAANSWMQTPAGGEMVDGKFVVHDYFQAILNPSMLNSVTHMFLATLETSLFVIGGISAWYILNRRHEAFFAKALKVIIAAAIAVAPLQIYIGHVSGERVYQDQPSKLAAIEARWETLPAGQPAPWSVLAWPDAAAETNRWEVNIPNGLGYILELQPTLSEPVLGLKEWPASDRPPMTGLIFYSFRLMAGIGFFFAGLMLLSILQWLRGQLAAEAIAQQRWLLRAWIFAAPLGYLAVESGWIVREVGRQPWTVYGLIRTSDAASHLPAAGVLTSLLFFAGVYTLLLVATLYFGSRILRNGPNLDLPIPGLTADTDLKTTPATFIPDQRPAEAQQ
ncbi:cytochrome ubiquinol oxidase subunit I [filamentous cyanobacterium CCP5]|nr:cytochrome ubiquinol oxidase subunit I [filamentous cyanobacterium CCP5]